MKSYRHLYPTLILALAALLLGSLLPLSNVLGQDGQPLAAQDVASPSVVDTVLGSAFTYQGYLQQGGAPVDDVACDLYFALWDEITGGNQLGTQTLNGVNVNEGVFTVQLDFGNVFTGKGVWLETAVQCPGDTGFTTLLPRQPITATPYALSLQPGAVVDSNSEPVGISLQANEAENQIALYAEADQAGSVAIYGNSANNTAVFGNSDAGRGVWGQSMNAAGVYGNSSAWAGVWGESTGASGVVGISAGEFNGGVYGENTGQGYGVKGKAPNSAGVFGESTAWIGVYGRSTDQTGVVGESDSHDGVRGTATAANRIGVKGIADAPGSVGVWGESYANTGVYGQSSTRDGVALWGKNLSGGTALKVEGNAVQSRDMNGLPKAMIFVVGHNTIAKCYNGLTGSTANNCGFSATWNQPGDNSISIVDFGFNVDDRFISATPRADSGIDDTKAFLIRDVTGTQVVLQNWLRECPPAPAFCSYEPMSYYIVVY